MKRTVHIAKNYKEAEQWDIQQILRMSPEERQQASAALKKRVYGNNNPDVREGQKLLS
ncbi:MAG TPA: hypothetical protein VK112_01135 [Fodinibius sp.]|nr:hypothetical protein [Fodinibius sp.]